MLKELLRKYLLEHLLDEAEPMGHFHDRLAEVVGSIQSIKIPDNVYLQDIPKHNQDAWIISQIKTQLHKKVAQVTAKDYPIGRGICLLVPLGIIKIQPLKGIPVNIIITAQRKEGTMSGFSYYITIYDNRMPTIVLADPKNPNNSSIGNQLNAHVKNSIDNGWPVNRDKSFIDKTFMDTILIDMHKYPVSQTA